MTFSLLTFLVSVLAMHFVICHAKLSGMLTIFSDIVYLLVSAHCAVLALRIWHLMTLKEVATNSTRLANAVSLL
jgi:hypothetical protein